MIRQHRTQRRAGVRVALMPRDIALLRALNRFRIARTSDLGRVFFPGRHRDVVAARLRRLYDGGYLDAHAPGLAAENVYALGGKGRALIAGQGGAVHGIPRRPWEHHLGIVSCWTRIAAATHAIQGVRLLRFLPDWEIRSQGVSVHFEVVPDALVELGVVPGPATSPMRLALEFDRGTESLEILRRKLAAFGGIRPGSSSFLGWPSFDLVVVLDAAGTARTEKVRELLGREWPGAPHVWTLQTEVERELRGLATLAQPPATASCCGSGSQGELTPSAATNAGAMGGGLPDE